MKDTLSAGMTVVDIGANVGTYTLLALQSVGGAGRVVAYEPTPRVFDILKNNVQVNGFLETGVVDLRRKAVTDEGSSGRPFYVPGTSLTHSSLFDEAEAGDGHSQVISVDTVSLDDDLETIDRIDVIKIDAEGAEPLILRGMQRLLSRSPDVTIFMEFAPQHLLRAGVEPRSFLTEMRQQGFQIMEIVEPTGDAREVVDDTLCNCFSVNLMLRQQLKR
jgi:FkbM family methyltransferase